MKLDEICYRKKERKVKTETAIKWFIIIYIFILMNYFYFYSYFIHQNATLYFIFHSPSLLNFIKFVITFIL